MTTRQINFIVFFVAIIILFLFLETLNFFLSGVPPYNKMNLTVGHMVMFKSSQNNYQINPVRKQKITNDKYYSGYLKNVKCGSWENGKENLVYYTDQYGFRENLDEYYEKVDNIILGDSFAESICVNSPDDFASQIRSFNNGTFLNLGRYQSQPTGQLLTAIKHFEKIKFKNLIWFFYEGNDYEIYYNNLYDKNRMKKDLQWIIKNTEKPKKIKNSKKNDIVTKNDFNLTWNYKKDYSVLLRMFIAERIRGLTTLIKYQKKYDDLLNYKKYDQVVSDMTYILNKKKIENKYLVYIPRYTRHALKTTNHPEIKSFNKLKKQVEEVANKNDFIFIDANLAFDKLENKLDIYNYGLPTHYNKLGYKLLAKYISNKL